ncbi:MAG: hypothetical protein RMJ66_04225 [Bacteroidia bacterium]|nr:alkaline shock response membrane anchor protein AmaP [Bacteroidia bacterium]MDW8134254.1 hypothetical protein [Bacteroidia bacterium]
MQSKSFLLFILAVAVLGTASTLWLPHWSGSMYVLMIVGYFFRGRFLWTLAAGGLLAIIWLLAALSWDIPNQGLLANRVGTLFGISRGGTWLITAGIGFILGFLGTAVGQALAKVLPQKPPRWSERR